MKERLPVRKQNRLKDYDYSQSGAYFITICTKDKRHILSEITVGADVLDGPRVLLSPYGEISDQCIRELNAFYEDVKVDSYVIMPNHIHLVLWIPYDGGASRTSPPTRQHQAIFRFVSTFKRFCNKKACCNMWQRSFHDHVIRDRADYDKIAEYIDKNPLTWQYDCFYNEK